MTRLPEADHPDQDTLADLVADALPVDTARQVEAHVMACPECVALLSDAERVGSVLRSPDPGPMPHEVWVRVAGALTEESARRSEHGGHAVPMATVPPPDELPWDRVGSERPTSDDTTTPPAAPSTTGRRSRRRARTQANAPDDTTGYTRVIRSFADLSPDTDGERDGTATLPALGGARLGALRPGRDTGPSRRDARDDELAGGRGTSDRRGLDGAAPGRRWTLLLAAAAAVTLLAGGGVVWGLTQQVGGSADADPGGSSSAPVTAALAPVVGTGENYTEADFAAQISRLAERAVDGEPGSAGPSGDATAAPPGDPSGAGTETNGPVAPASSALSDPAVLKRCLSALAAQDQTPVAVDIARYENREAAIIVLRASDGGLEAWAVSRDCGAGNDASFGFVAVPPGG